MEFRIYESDRPGEDVVQDSPEYFEKMGRYCVGAGFNSQHTSFLQAADVNTRFFFGDQWINQEDLDPFFKDENNNAKGRIKVVKNFIKPLVIQYMGNARIMDITFNAKNIGPMAITRREEKLAEAMYLTNVAAVATPELKQNLKQTRLIGDTVDETKEIFENTYVDDFIEAINAIIGDVKMTNEFDEMQVDHAMHLAFSGYCGAEYLEQNGEFIWDPVLPDEVFFDRTAKRPDLQDGEFIGRWKLMLPSEIFERKPTLSKPVKDAIKNAVRRNNINEIYGGKLPVFRVYFRDTVKIKFGYVRDEFEEVYLEKIDYVFSGEEKPRFTEKDVVPFDELNADQKKIFKSKSVYTVEPEVIKFVEFIPYEIVGEAHEVTKYDLILDSGNVPHMDTNYMKPMEAKFPIKSSCWLYYKGFIDTPINALINPQRMINRYESVKEHRVSSHLGQNVFVDEDALAGSSDNFADILANMHQNRPSRIRARNIGIQNVVGVTGSDLPDVNIFTVLKNDMRDDMDRIIGVNDSMRGENQGQNKLVGVMEQEIQRSSLIQEPFYGALIRLYKQIYQCSANVGKRVYINNKKQLNTKMGEKYARVIELSEEFNTEDVRVDIKRVADLDQQVRYTNQILDAYLQGGLISREQHANLWNRATLDDVARAIRVFAGHAAVAEKEMAKIQESEKRAAEVQMRADEQELRDREDRNMLIQLDQNEKDRQVKAQKNISR